MSPINCSYSIEGKGPALFLIHGIGAARDAWRFVLPELIKKFTVITYDLRGHGSSPVVPPTHVPQPSTYASPKQTPWKS